MITQIDLESRLWAAANALRGPVDAADYKTYVFPMLFWKWISDTWDYEHKQAVEEYGEELTDEIEADFHRFELPKNTRWSVVTKTQVNLGDALARAFQRIEQANPKALARIFGDAFWGNEERLPPSALRGLVKAFDDIPLDPSTVSHDLLGAGYEYLLKKFADVSGQKAGEFFTPREVVNLLVAILQPEPGESIYDPACGSGGMLVATINQVRGSGQDHRTLRLYGQEVNLTTSAIAKMNLFLHEIEDFEIKRGDTLRKPLFKEPSGALTQFDVVIANPPFSLESWGADQWASDPRAVGGVPPAKNGDFAFVQHMVASMRPGTGRVGVVMPHGVLFRGGAEAKIRQSLIERDLLEAVVGLPPNLFYSTSIPACILVFRHQKPADRKDTVVFVDGSERFAKGKNQNVMSYDDIKALTEACRTGLAPDGPELSAYVHVADFDEIKANGFDLNIGRYITKTTGKAVDLGTALVAYADARTQRLAAEAAMFERLAAAGIDLSGLGVGDV
ncbi:type I restriction-modification system subunit M [Parafrankia elaeagni]|uniref:type I restriction-modification system subunit M n=1 Tax=Parafrankia elaeagni TaxID=222534 RepID=UPI00036E34D0|nr:class I SAM-dependent DNA methyltransferase [Parafrankia elaeagni]